MVPRALEERQIAEQVGEPVEGARLGELPGQLLEPPQAFVTSLEVVRQAQMRRLALLLAREVPVPDGLAQVVVSEAE